MCTTEDQDMAQLVDQVAQLVTETPGAAWDNVLSLRSQFVPEVWDGKLANADTWRRGTDAVMRMLKEIDGQVDSEIMCPGHGPGHWARDYINAVRLFSDHSMWEGRTETEVVAGVVAGVFHDIGNTVVERYNDANTPVRHAEVGAFLVQEIFRSNACGLTSQEQLAVLWAIAAHTNYLKSQEVEWGALQARVTIQPYMDTHDGRPLWGVHFARWVDRLDCSGAYGFPWRHLLTTYEAHHDYSGDDFFAVKFVPHLVPRIRPQDAREGRQRMLEHLEMFARSQVSTSPYGKYDYGKMLTMRDTSRRSLLNLIDVVEHDSDMSTASLSYDEFLAFLKVIEPSNAGKSAAAHVVQKMQKELDQEVQKAWLRGARLGLVSYAVWHRNAMQDLESAEAPTVLPVIGDLTKLNVNGLLEA